jgi:hypothetical protein
VLGIWGKEWAEAFWFFHDDSISSGWSGVRGPYSWRRRSLESRALVQEVSQSNAEQMARCRFLCFLKFHP